MEPLIEEQAVEEMLLLWCRDCGRRMLFIKEFPDIPLIFVNTFQDLGAHQLDDVCLRYPKSIGLAGEDYGTIHLPGASRLAHSLDKSKKLYPER